MNNKMILEKIQQSAAILREKNIDMWMIFTRESACMRDPSMDMVVGANCTWQSAYIITKSGDTIAILGSLDVPNMKLQNTYREITGYVKSIKEPLVDILKKYNPNKIAINYSRDSNMADGLTFGMYQELLAHLEGTDFTKRLISSEDIIASLRGRKSSTEIMLMKKAAEETLKIYDAVTGFIRPGVSEKQIGAFIRDIVEKKGFGLAWDADHCPAVFTGPDTAGAHAGPTDRLVQPGHVLNIDFGILYQGYASDLQRTWYIRREGEAEAPAEVMHGFNTIKESIQLSAKGIKPGRKGCEIDDIARNYITGQGYEEFQHALGHQVGRTAHDGGGLLAPRWERYGDLPYKEIEENQVYTIEPRLPVKDYGIATIEEEVLVTKDGCEFISAPQQNIILI